MLEILCGSKTIQKILLFLFVNHKCYGTQLYRVLQTPLTPIQKALRRLEEAEIVASEYEGKTRIYRFNPAYPLLNELESLLKKAYTLLPPQEKKKYSCDAPKMGNLSPAQTFSTLIQFWERLNGVKQLTFNAKSRSKEESGWNGRGQGEVAIEKEGESALIFHEKGSWRGIDQKEMNFSNIFRWTLDRRAGTISLEHLRRGMNQPVFLFYLSPSGPRSLASLDSHLCENDAYVGKILWDAQSLRLNWRVIGPRKNEEIDYYYS